MRGSTFFRAKDKLYLSRFYIAGYKTFYSFFGCVLNILSLPNTFAQINRLYDFQRFINSGIVHSFCALHDGNRGERITTDVLHKRWVTFWACSALEVGSPMVTDAEYDPETPIGTSAYKSVLLSSHCT